MGGVGTLFGGVGRTLFGGKGEEGLFGTGSFEADYTRANAVAGRQNTFIAELQNMVRGEGPNAAQEMLRSNQDRVASQAQGQAASLGGAVDPALALRNMRRQQEDGRREVEQNAVVLQAQQAQNAQGMIGNQLSGLYNQEMGQQTMEQGNFNESATRRLGLTKAAGDAGAKIATSDENSKKDIKGAASSVESFLDALSAHTYEYKNKKDGKGEQLGVMAQDLEKTGPVGKQMVMDTPEGKKVDYGKGLGAMLASMVEIHERIKELESKKGKK